MTLAPGPSVPGSEGGQYCTSQPALLRITAYFRQIGQISRPARLQYILIIPIYKIWLSAAPCNSLFDLYGPAVYFLSLHGYIRPRMCVDKYRLLQSPSHRARLIKVARVITATSRHRLSILWHQHPAASHINKRWYVFSEINHCESNAIGHRVTIQTRKCSRLNVPLFSVPRQNGPW
jgi:hypothetical protein